MAYKIYNSPSLTTTAMAPVTTGTGLKTMLQVAPPSTMKLSIISWGYTLAAVPGGTGGQLELLETDVAATVTALTESGVYCTDPQGTVSGLTFGTAATGFTASAEGSIGATRFFDDDLIAPTAGALSVNESYTFMPDERPTVGAGKFLRVRANFNSAVNALVWVAFVRVG